MLDFGGDRKSLDGHVMKAHAASGSDKLRERNTRNLVGRMKGWFIWYFCESRGLSYSLVLPDFENDCQWPPISRVTFKLTNSSKTIFQKLVLCRHAQWRCILLITQAGSGVIGQLDDDGKVKDALPYSCDGPLGPGRARASLRFATIGQARASEEK